jgi:hypothetical protein
MPLSRRIHDQSAARMRAVAFIAVSFAAFAAWVRSKGT